MTDDCCRALADTRAELSEALAEVQRLRDDVEHRAAIKREGKRRNRARRAERDRAEREAEAARRKASDTQRAALDRLAHTTDRVRLAYTTKTGD